MSSGRGSKETRLALEESVIFFFFYKTNRVSDIILGAEFNFIWEDFGEPFIKLEVFFGEL